MSYRSTGSGSNGTGPAAAPGVPPGTQVDDIVVIGLYVEGGTETIIWPTGFTLRTSETTNSTTRGRLYVAWKRITVAGDSTDEPDGDYDVTWTTSAVFEAVAIAFSGRVKAGDPFDASNGASNAGTTATTVAVTVTTVVDSDDLILFSSNHATNAGDFTAPSGMTERFDATAGGGGHHLAAYTQNNVGAAGAQAKTATSTGTTGNSVPKILGGGLQADRVAVRAVVATSGVAGTALTVTLPTHKAGDRLLAIVGGKYDTASAPSCSTSGWTLVKFLTGGTGAAGAGTGTTFLAIFAKNALSAAETNPQIDPGGTAPNNWTAQAVALIPATGFEWRDAIGANVAWIEGASDTDATTSTLTGTTSSFAGQPISGDLLLGVHVGPSQSGSAFNAQPTISATGMSNGLATTVLLYSDTSAGDDSMLGTMVKEGFTGPLTGGVTTSATYTGWSTASGTIAHIAVRQIVATIGLSVAGTIPQPVGAFSLTGFNDSDLAVAGIIPQPVGAFTLTGFNESEVGVTGAVPLPIGAIALSVTPVEPELTVAGVIPLPVGSFTLTGFNDSEIDIAGVIPVPVGAIDLDVTPSDISLAIVGVIPLPVGEFSLDAEDLPEEVDQDVVDDDEVDQAAHEEEWHADVAVVEPAEPLPVAYDVLSIYTSISLSGTQPVVAGSVRVRKPKLRDRILIDGVDVTFYNDVRTPTPEFSLIEPLTYGVCTLLFPQIFPLIQTLSEIPWLRRGAPVLIQRVDDEGNVVATDYRGRIMGWDTSGDFMVSVGGLFSGPASVRFRPMPMVRRIEDVGYWLMTAFRHQKQPLVYEDFGVGLISRGENYYLDHVLELCALGVKRNGSQITVHYDEDLRKWVAAPKDTTTIDATVYFDPGDMNPALTRDFTVETDEVFATAHLSDGTQILNSVWPGMQQEDPIPAYPGVLEEGDNNEDVAILIARLVLLGYLKYVDRPGGFDDDVMDAIWSARADADQLGSGDDYALDEDLWDWLWDLDAVGYTDKEARILPMAQRQKVRFWDRSATGNRIGINSSYDPVYAALTVSQKLELGHVKSKNHAVQLARTLLDDGSDNWIGTLSTMMSFVAGEHTPGDPITEADLMSGRELRPGMNLWAPLFQGGTLFHISSVDISNDGDSWSLAIDTRSRDTMQIDGILERNRENRTSPARAFWNDRSSSSASDTIFNHDEHFGILGSNIPLPADEWLVYPVPAGDFGTVSHTIMRTIDDPAEFAMMVFQKKVTPEWVTARVANPLNSADEWWADESVRADFKDRGIKYAAGSEEDPCGYFPGRKSGGHDLTGRWEDEASFAYGGDSLVFWVCIYADRASKLKRGEQFDVQRELGT